MAVASSPYGSGMLSEGKGETSRHRDIFRLSGKGLKSSLKTFLMVVILFLTVSKTPAVSHLTDMFPLIVSFLSLLIYHFPSAHGA